MSEASENGLSTGIVGAIGELRVAADLFEKGYYVFRAMSQSSPCDLIAIKLNGTMLRIEVKSTAPNKDNILRNPAANDTSKYDLVALICGDRIEYRLSDDVASELFKSV